MSLESAFARIASFAVGTVLYFLICWQFFPSLAQPAPNRTIDCVERIFFFGSGVFAARVMKESK